MNLFCSFVLDICRRMKETESQKKSKPNNTKLLVAQAVLIIINTLFLLKYSSRITPFYIPLAAGFVILQSCLLCLNPVGRFLTKFYQPLFYLTIGLIAGAVLYTQAAIAQETLNVDRWSVISSFLETLQRGEYPYSARSHLGNPPGPMPVYFLIAYPFYLLNILSVLSASGYLIALFLIRKYIAPAPATVYFCMMMISPFMYWEIATRSNIMTYSTLVWLGLMAFEQIPKTKFDRKLRNNAVLCGLLLSTRSVFIVGYILYYLSSLERGNYLVYLKYYLLAFTSFVAPLAAVYLIWPNIFLQINPFLVQSEFLLPSWIIYLYLIMCVVIALVLRWAKDLSFYTGWMLFGLVMLYFGYHIDNEGLEETFFDSRGDLSYFIFCVPFLLYYAVTQPSASK